MNKTSHKSTKSNEYTRRLQRLSGKNWKTFLDVQRPYRWNIRRLNPGITLDIGCGVGRLLKHLPAGSVGIDHNPNSIKVARKLGLKAFAPQEFIKSSIVKKKSFDSIILAHVVEHLNPADSKKLLKKYLPFLKQAGQVIIICPQAKGYTTDETHVRFYDFQALEELLSDVGLRPVRRFSFPLPRQFGRIFTYNEYVVVARR